MNICLHLLFHIYLNKQNFISFIQDTNYLTLFIKTFEIFIIYK